MEQNAKIASFSFVQRVTSIRINFFPLFLLQLLTKVHSLLIFAVQNQQKTTKMDKLTERIMNNDGLNETEAKAKLNLIYIKMQQSDIKQFVDEFTEWLMDEKKLNYKAILQTPDVELHDTFLKEFKR